MSEHGKADLIKYVIAAVIGGAGGVGGSFGWDKLRPVEIQSIKTAVELQAVANELRQFRAELKDAIAQLSAYTALAGENKAEITSLKQRARDHDEKFDKIFQLANERTKTLDNQERRLDQIERERRR